MQDVPLKTLIRYEVTKAQVGDLADTFWSDERGELGSWLIFAAGLAAAAVAAIGLLKPWFTKKVGEITSN